LPAIRSALIAGKPAPTGKQIRGDAKGGCTLLARRAACGGGKRGELQQVGLRTVTGCWWLAKRYLSRLQINLRGEKKNVFLSCELE